MSDDQITKREFAQSLIDEGRVAVDLARDAIREYRTIPWWRFAERYRLVKMAEHYAAEGKTLAAQAKAVVNSMERRS